MRILYFFTFLITLVSFGCKNKPAPNELNLMKYGIPYSIKAPKNVEISTLGSGNLADVLIKNKSGYDIQIFMSDAVTNDFKKLKQQKKEALRLNPYFIKIVEEYDDGFIFEKSTGPDTRSYDFALIKVVGDREINFQCGNTKEFSETEVKAMIQSIR
jgi:hypothetical protein